MELHCRIPRESFEDLQFLTSEGYDPQLMKGSVEMKFPDPLKMYLISDFPCDTHYYMKLWEFGGGMTKTGSAYVIAGIDGQKLIPTEIFKTGHLANNIHAEFEERAAHTIHATKNGKIDIKYFQIVYIHDSVSIACKDIWKGGIKSVPNKYVNLEDACFTAWRKANCYHCREAMYIKG